LARNSGSIELLSTGFPRATALEWRIGEFIIILSTGFTGEHDAGLLRCRMFG
jgi:hypothetical protein